MLAAIAFEIVIICLNSLWSTYSGAGNCDWLRRIQEAIACKAKQSNPMEIKIGASALFLGLDEITARLGRRLAVVAPGR
jgi:hypothetical protein